jgi:hypothetical protein
MGYMVPSRIARLRKIRRSQSFQDFVAGAAATLGIRVVAEYGLLEDLFGLIE